MLALWAGFWYFFSDVHIVAIESLAANFRERGRIVNYAETSVQGFPNRFDTTVEEPNYYDPVHRFGWNADFVQILSLIYTPYHMIFAFSERQRLVFGGDEFNIMADKLQASLKLRNNGNQKITSFIADADTIELTSTAGWTAAFSDALFAVRPLDGTDDSIEVAFRAVHAADSFIGQEGTQANSLLESFLSLDASMILQFDRPFTQDLCEAGLVSLEKIKLVEGQLRWRDAQLSVNTDFDVNDGTLSGVFNVDVGDAGFGALLAKVPNGDGFLRNRDRLELALQIFDKILGGGINGEVRGNKITLRTKNGQILLTGDDLIDVPVIKLCGLSDTN